MTEKNGIGMMRRTSVSSQEQIDYMEREEEKVETFSAGFSEKNDDDEDPWGKNTKEIILQNKPYETFPHNLTFHS